MNTKTDKEKAKAYDIALEKIEMLLGSGSSCSREELEYVFPELKENEDKDVKESVVNIVKEWACRYQIDVESELAWLGAQGEQKPLGFNIGDEITVNGQICKVVAVEQNSAYKIDQHSLPVSDDSSLPTFNEDIYHPCSEKAYDWSEEDQETIDYLIDYLEDKLDCSYTDLDKETFTKEITLLKSLRTHSQWKPSDEQMNNK